jgi:hypothetical protein
VAGRARSGAEIEQDLERQFADHLPADERVLYLMIDQRQVPVEDDEGNEVEIARGNFLMPIGTPCLLTKWREAAGVRWGSYLVPETGEAGELPVGEIRTQDGRVFRLDCPA